MQQFTATGTYSDNSQQALSSATWSSSNTSVSTIDGNGVATAMAAGVTTISAAVNGVSGSSTLTVTAPQVSISNVTVHTDSPDPQFATIQISDGTLIDVWGAKDSNGLPTTVRTIQVQGSNGKSATFNFDTNGNLIQWTGPFPGSGSEAPIVMNFDQGGVCDIAGNWNGSWNRRHKDGTLHLSDLSADVTDTSTPNSYDVNLAVTDSNGTTYYSFSGNQTSETNLGFTFGFGPATIDGVSGDAVGFLTPDGMAMSGYYVGLAPGAAGGWSLIKSAATGP